MKENFIKPDWPAPKNIQAFVSTKNAPSDRAKFCETLELPAKPHWLTQTHSNVAIELPHTTTNADASITQARDQVCAVLTADCLPILLCDRQGLIVAAVHAGWRGLYNGVIKNTVKCLNIKSANLLAWLGPAISAKNYEVDSTLREHFLQKNKAFETAFFKGERKWQLSLCHLAKIQLMELGIQYIYGGNLCTYDQDTLFYSYRRDGEKTGRIASLIWISAA